MRINNLRQEIVHLTRYAGIGLINSAVGFICIFSAMAIGFSPITSNVIGYGVGFFMGFMFAKKFIFRSNGDFIAEVVRYLLSFIICFLCNLLMLQLALNVGIHEVISQFIAAVSYAIMMYLLSRLFIFNTTSGR